MPSGECVHVGPADCEPEAADTSAFAFALEKMSSIDSEQAPGASCNQWTLSCRGWPTHPTLIWMDALAQPAAALQQLLLQPFSCASGSACSACSTAKSECVHVAVLRMGLGKQNHGSFCTWGTLALQWIQPAWTAPGHAQHCPPGLKSSQSSVHVATD